MRLIRFVVTVLILALICYCVYYLLDLNKKYKEEKTTVVVEDVKLNEDSEPINNEEKVEIIIPQDNKDEITEDDIKRLVTEADKIYDTNISANVHKSYNEEVGSEIYGDLENTSGDKKVQVLVQYAGTMVSIMPFDKSNDSFSEQYHFGNNNNLVLYVAIKGESKIEKYYFSYGKLIKSVLESGDAIELSDDEAELIINRAQNIYNRYIK